jgi:hypothetical protein
LGFAFGGREACGRAGDPCGGVETAAPAGREVVCTVGERTVVTLGAARCGFTASGGGSGVTADGGGSGDGSVAAGTGAAARSRHRAATTPAGGHDRRSDDLALVAVNVAALMSFLVLRR